MPIRMHGRSGRPHTYRFVKINPQSSQFVRPCAPPDQVAGSYVHFLPQARRDVPCLHEECPWCALDKKEVFYLPVRLFIANSTLRIDGRPTFDVNGGRWLRHILAVTEALQDLLNVDHRGEVIEIARRGKFVNSRLSWHLIQKLTPDVQAEDEYFDVQPTIDVMWERWVTYAKPRGSGVAEPKPQTKGDGAQLEPIPEPALEAAKRTFYSEPPANGNGNGHSNGNGNGKH